MTCWLARDEGHSRGGRAVIAGLLIYNSVVVAVLAYAGMRLGGQRHRVMAGDRPAPRPGGVLHHRAEQIQAGFSKLRSRRFLYFFAPDLPVSSSPDNSSSTASKSLASRKLR